MNNDLQFPKIDDEIDFEDFVNTKVVEIRDDDDDDDDEKANEKNEKEVKAHAFPLPQHENKKENEEEEEDSFDFSAVVGNLKKNKEKEKKIEKKEEEKKKVGKKKVNFDVEKLKKIRKQVAKERKILENQRKILKGVIPRCFKEFQRILNLIKTVEKGWKKEERMNFSKSIESLRKYSRVESLITDDFKTAMSRIEGQNFYCVGECLEKSFNGKSFLFRKDKNALWRFVFIVEFSYNKPVEIKIPYYVAKYKVEKRELIKDQLLTNFGVSERRMKEIRKKLEMEIDDLGIFKNLVKTFKKDTIVGEEIRNVFSKFVFLKIPTKRNNFFYYYIGEEFNFVEREFRIGEEFKGIPNNVHLKNTISLFNFNRTYYQNHTFEFDEGVEVDGTYKLCECFLDDIDKNNSIFEVRKSEIFSLFSISVREFNQSFFLNATKYMQEYIERWRIHRMGLKIAKKKIKLLKLDPKFFKEREKELERAKVIQKMRRGKDDNLFLLGEVITHPVTKEMTFTGRGVLLMRLGNDYFKIYDGRFRNGRSNEGILHFKKFLNEIRSTTKDFLFDIDLKMESKKVDLLGRLVQEIAYDRDEKRGNFLKIMKSLKTWITQFDLFEFEEQFAREFKMIRPFRKNSKLIYIGETQQDQPHGVGVILEKTKGFFYKLKKFHFKTYEGSFKNGLKSGKGIEYNLSMLRTYEGNFQNDLHHGKGIDYVLQERPVKGRFENGKLVESYEMFDFQEMNYLNLKSQLITENMRGKGAVGIIYAVQLEGKPRAAKIIKLGGLDSGQRYKVKNSFRKSSRLCCKFDHPNVLKNYGIITSKKEVIGLIMELCQKDLNAVVVDEKLGMDKKLTYLLQCCEGMKYLHSLKIMNRDLKWGNCLVNNKGDLVIADFDTFKDDEASWKMNVEQTNTGIGTCSFLAPEVVTGKYTRSIDIYSFGIMIYSLVFSLTNPYSETKECKCGALVQNIPHFTFPTHVSECGLRPELSSEKIEKLKNFTWLIDLMKICWHQDDLNRPTFEEISLLLKSKINKYKDSTVSIEVEGLGKPEKYVLVRLEYSELLRKIQDVWENCEIECIRFRVDDIKLEEVTEKNFKDLVTDKNEKGEMLNFFVKLKNAENVLKKKAPKTMKDYKEMIENLRKENRLLKRKMEVMRVNHQKSLLYLKEEKDSDMNQVVRKVNRAETVQVRNNKKRELIMHFANDGKAKAGFIFDKNKEI